MDITVVVANRTTEPQPFSCWLLGIHSNQ